MTKPSLTPLARSLRRAMTEPERRLWFRLRNRQIGGAKFLRQFPIGAYIADFCCREKHLVIEIDGWTHSAPGEVERDVRRSADLGAAGYRVIRFNNDEVMRNLEGVLETISLHLKE